MGWGRISCSEGQNRRSYNASVHLVEDVGLELFSASRVLLILAATMTARRIAGFRRAHCLTFDHRLGFGKEVAI
jgi:hypothetical protein